MSTSDGRASERDRANAIKVIEAAAAEGVIVPADRDQRIVQLKAAQTPVEIDLVLGNLRNRAEPPVPPIGQMVHTALSDTVSSGSIRGLPFGPLFGGFVSVVAGIALVIFLVNLLNDADISLPSPNPSVATPANPSNPGSTPTPENQGNQTPGAVDVLSVRGYTDLMAAIKEETGGTLVFDAGLYPTYAVVHLPIDRESQRESFYRWDGRTLDSFDSFGKSQKPRFDLASVNVKAMLRLSARIRTVVEDPTAYYCLLHAPDQFDKAVMYAYANNKFSEGGYISADRNGKVIRKATW